MLSYSNKKKVIAVTTAFFAANDPLLAQKNYNK